VGAATIDTEAMNAFMAEPRNATVAGIRSDGRPHLTPNWIWFDGDRFYNSTTRDRAKYRIFSRDARVQLIIDDVGFRYVGADLDVVAAGSDALGLGPG